MPAIAHGLWTRRHQHIVTNGLARKLIARLNAGKQWPLHRPLDNDLARVHRKRGFDQRLLIGARLFQMMQELELLFHRRALGAPGKHGVQLYHVGSGELALPDQLSCMAKAGNAVLARM